MNDMPIYLDYNATTPLDPEVITAMLPYLHNHFGNPSSVHAYGQITRKAVQEARQQLALLLGCDTDEIIFTGSGTESNNTVIKGVAEAYQHRGRHIITTAIEHPAILEPCHVLEQKGFDITILPVNQHGMISLDDLKNAITDETILISVMLANNEVGTIQPVKEIAEIAHAHNIFIHTDAAQAVGKYSVDVNDLDVDFLSVAGHKLYAPKGVGGLFVRRGVDLPKFMHGASHENNRRAGTENVLELVGLGEAARVARQNLDAIISHMAQCRDQLYDGLVANIPDIIRNGHLSQSLPNTLSVSFKNVEANRLLERIQDRVAASAGAACHADQVTVSAVLKAMNIPLNFAMGTLRLSTGKFTTTEEIEAAINVITQGVAHLRDTG